MNVNKDAIPDANSLKKRDKSYSELVKEANTILSYINDQILIAHSGGKQQMVVQLPNLLKVDGFSNRESQLFVYSSILKLLEEKHYRVRIKIDQKVSSIIIVWSCESEVLELMNLEEYLKARYV